MEKQFISPIDKSEAFFLEDFHAHVKAIESLNTV